MLDVADTGAQLTGVTIAPNEADIGESLELLLFSVFFRFPGNEKFAALGLSDRCKIVAADCHKMPFGE